MSVDSLSYVLITAARDEEKYIGKTIESVLSQSIMPKEWVIVSDGSKDGTDQIIQSFARKHAFIRFLRLEPDSGRNFKSHVFAITSGYGSLESESYDLIGNLDADITMGPDYYKEVIRRFQEDPGVGLAGGWLYERPGDTGSFVPRPYNSLRSVPNGVQLFRRKCFEQIGGYIPIPQGGTDTVAEMMTIFKGWKVKVFQDLPAYHHKPTSSAEGKLHGAFRQGRASYAIGFHPLFAVFCCLHRIAEKPVVAYALARLVGYVCAALAVEKKSVSEEFVKSLHAEHKNLLKRFFLEGRKPDRFGDA